MYKKICVALVAKNEEANVEYMITKLRKVSLSNIFVVDEESEDRTAEIAKNLNIPVYQREGKGFGVGVITAINIAKDLGYEYVIRVDCDGSYPPEEIPKLLKYIPEYDVISGKRSIKKVRSLHRFPNKILTFLTNLIFNGRLKDINSGMRLLKVNKFYGLLDAEGFDLEAQISIRALKKDYKIKEVPINFMERHGGKSKIKISDGFLILSRIIKERFIK